MWHRVLRETDDPASWDRGRPARTERSEQVLLLTAIHDQPTLELRPEFSFGPVLINTGLQPGDNTNMKCKPFQRFRGTGKPLKRFTEVDSLLTGLKPGVNENAPRNLVI